MLATLALLACTGKPLAPEPAPRSFRILAMNDVYRIEGIPEDQSAGLARLRTLRARLEAEDPDLVVTGAGDFLYPSLLSRTLYGEQMIDVLNRLDGDPAARDERLLLTFGNHEFDKGDCKGGGLLDARIDESAFRWVSSNVRFLPCEGREAPGGEALVADALLDIGGVRVGVIGLTLALDKPVPYAEIGDLVEAGRSRSAALRAAGAEVVLAITHQRMADDEALLRTLGPEGPDLILGGHEHDHQSAEVDGRLVVKADADARTVELLTVMVEGDSVEISHELIALRGEDPAPDPAVAEVVDGWLARHQERFCADAGLPAGCLDAPLGRTQVALQAEELRIRKFETNLGDFVADVALATNPGAQVALINSGSLRLNQDLPAGTVLTRRHIETLFAYPSPMTLLQVDGATLVGLLERSIQDWTGNGHWLQVAGLRYTHDPGAGTVSAVELRAGSGWRPLDPAEKVTIVVPDFLATGGDGYSALSAATRVGPGTDLKEQVVAAITAAGEAGIAPAVDGRICNRAAGTCP